MSKLLFKLSSGSFFQDWTNPALFTVDNDWSNVASIVGYMGTGLVSGTAKDAGAVIADNPAASTGQVFVNKATTFASGGVAQFSNPNGSGDAVVGLQGSGGANAPNLVIYLDSSGTEKVHLTMDLRDIDVSDNAIQQIAIQYRIGDTGTWTNIAPLTPTAGSTAYIADASAAGGATKVTHVDITLPSNADNQSNLQIRVLTTDAASSDEWIGIDNIGVSGSAIVVGADTTAPTIAAASPADNATNIAAGANLTVTFSEAVHLGTGNITLTDGAGDVRTIAVTDTSQVSLNGQVLTINPSADLRLSATYHLTLAAGTVLDAANNAFAGNAANPIDFATALKMTAIYDIQGAGHTSALVGQTVRTGGVVTAIDTSGTKGFWIQDAIGDNNIATSDAVFVVSASTTVKVGDMLELQGVVEENAGTFANNLTVTQLNSVQVLNTLSHNNVIAATVIGAGGRVAPGEVVDSDHFGVFNPTHDAVDFYESVEGMLLTIKNVQVVSNSVAGATFVVPDNGASSSGANDRGGLTNSLGDVNPERFQIYADTGVTAGISGLYTTGDQLGDVTGVMSYYNANYELLPTVLPGAAVHHAAARESTALAGDATHLSVGSYNLNSLSVSDSQAKYDALAHDIVASLAAPDLLGLEGVQDNNGNVSGELGADITIGKLIDAIVAAGGPRYQFAQVDPSAENTSGGTLNTNVRSVVLYNPDRVQYVEESARLLDDSSAANGDSFANAVHPLAADFVFRGETVTYIGVDNVSRAGGDELFGKNQPATVIGDQLRADQIASVQDFVNELQQAHPGNHVVVGGNFNAYQFDPAMTALASGTGLVNLANTLAATDRYTSANEGSNAQLDHLLVSGELAGGALFDNVHFNTNQAANTTQTDRDPVLGTFYINSAPVAATDSFDVNEDTTLTANALQGVLANDKDVNPDILTVSLVTGTAHGSLQLNKDGSFSYTAEANYNGADAFSYSVNDGHGASSAITTVHLTVAAVDDAPILSADAADSVLIEEGRDGFGIDVAVVQLHASDIDSTTLALGDDGWIAQGDGLFTQDGQYGTATLDINSNTVTYQLDNGLGDTDALAGGVLVHESFIVTLSDGANAVSTPVTFDIQGANDNPYGKADRATVVEDSSVLINVLANDGDAEDNVLGIILDSARSSLGATLTLENGQVRYSADADAFDMLATGTSVVDRFSYRVADGHGGLSGLISAQVTVQEAGDNVSLYGTDGNDTFRVTPGKDTTYDGGKGNDKIVGADGADTLLGGDGNDAIDGGAGNDRLSGGAGADNLLGGDGDDALDGGSGNDSLSGGNGNDLLDGGVGDDTLQGGAGADHLIGNSGNDAMLGGAGNDLLDGGSGTDLFVFSAQAGRDTIVGFNPGEDLILTAYSGSGSLGSPSTWNTTLRNSPAPAPAAEWRFTNFDADGNGATDSVLISGGTLGGDSIVLDGWSTATLIGNNYLNAQGQAIGGWLH
jgi:VCBS repeat-containing protein